MDAEGDGRISNAHAARLNPTKLRKLRFAGIPGKQRCRLGVLCHQWTVALLPLRSGAVHPHHLDARALGALPRHTPGRRRLMRVRSGDLEVAVHEWGSGPPLLLLHGLGDDHRAWRNLVPQLSLRHRVVAPDLRGHGGTSLGRADGTLGQLAGDVVLLLETLGLDRVDLAGFSLGGTIALQVAIQAPDRVRRLVGVATSSRVGKTALAWYRERARIADSGAGPLRALLAEDVGTLFLPGSPLVEDHLRLRQEATADPRGFANACRANVALAAAPLDPDLPRITAPTLLIAARQDPLCPPRAAEIVAAAVPGARLGVMEGSGHEIPLEQPEALAARLLDFLEER